ncbi:unnamed protein product [Meloidogyne enterolobii]|uniref:Uncharacterized protein n=1 Tax=Meloidogyne enterolobii TaxID=390850 RepID=A0ACB1A3S4_MELEN
MSDFDFWKFKIRQTRGHEKGALEGGQGRGVLRILGVLVEKVFTFFASTTAV